MPSDILLVGRSGTGKSYLVNMITGIPDALLSGAAVVSNSYSGGTSQIASYAAPPFGTFKRSQIWDTPGFATISSGQQITTKINDWITRIYHPVDSRTRDVQVVWCIHASEIGDPGAWQQFRDVHEACRSKPIHPTLVVINQSTSTQHSDADWKMACENQLRQLDLPNSCLLTIRRHSETSSPEYENDSQSLRQFIRQHMPVVRLPELDTFDFAHLIIENYNQLMGYHFRFKNNLVLSLHAVG